METAGRIDVHFCENIALVEDEPTFSPARTPFPSSPQGLPACSMVVGLQGGTLTRVCEDGSVWGLLRAHCGGRQTTLSVFSGQGSSIH